MSGKKLLGAICIYRTEAFALVGKDLKGPYPWPVVEVLESIKIGGHDRIEELFRSAANFFKNYELDSLSISSFGPFESLHYDPADNSYGRISELQTALDTGGKSLPDLAKRLIGVETVYVTTDVNAAALGELCIRAVERQYPFSDMPDQQITSSFRETVVSALNFGRGIGGGISHGGQLYRRHVHPEMGHMPVGRMHGHKEKGICPFHTDCITGYAASAALQDKEGRISKENLDRFSYYAARLCASASYLISPDIIVLGGSTIEKYPQTVEMIQQELSEIFKGRRKDDYPYIIQERLDNLSNYISKITPNSQVFGTILFGSLMSKKA